MSHFFCRRSCRDLYPELLGQFRRVFSLRRNESSSSDEDEPESPDSDSDDERSTTSRRHLYPHRYAKRMSLLAPANKSPASETDFSFHAGGDGESITSRTTRRFFHSSAVWDPKRKTVGLRENKLTNGVNGIHVGEAMERGGNGTMDVDIEGGSQIEEDWKDGDVPISVES